MSRNQERWNLLSLSVECLDGNHFHIAGVYVVSHIPVASATLELSMFEQLQDLRLADYSDKDNVDF